MTILKLWFTDFDELFDPQDNFIYNLLCTHYTIKLSSKDPDYLIYSCYGNDFLKYNCIRIFITGENLVPDFNLCDYGIGFNHLQFGDRYLRYPNFAFYEDQFKELLTPKNFDETILLKKEYFCNFIYANSLSDPARDTFFQLLNKYKLVSSPGKHLNNISLNVGERFAEDWMYTKIDFQSKCKFSIAFENTSSCGYTTEKILHAFISSTIPIYWGNPDVAKDFNPKAFINCHNYQSFEQVVEEIKRIDSNHHEYIQMLNESPFINHVIPKDLSKETLLQFLQNIFEKENTKRRSEYGTQYKYESNMKAAITSRERIMRISKFVNPLKFLIKKKENNS
ncbi:glycosyl transferase family 10 (putative fucosyltransferase) [Gillisia mitskevichiae]|uniref:Glycosyl transferase family 10 (Putative fucosyltransferase) n=1 Tax=Gillisia mitskevichiae TaxID=270921 RepID=A0A495PKC1_9FLAO|nr:glycosyltransferase family 10 [Gillisia mitskevichiae]RKS50617.1 glycosyl transferase family 10 (putative fucosyltransferase) [Gillisia mitskevichiae]